MVTEGGLRTVTLGLNTSNELMGMASNPFAGALADLITVIVSPIPRYANIGSILPHNYISSMAEILV